MNMKMLTRIANDGGLRDRKLMVMMLAVMLMVIVMTMMTVLVIMRMVHGDDYSGNNVIKVVNISNGVDGDGYSNVTIVTTEVWVMIFLLFRCGKTRKNFISY